MVGLERVVDSTVGAGVEQRLITAVNRGKFFKKVDIYIALPYRTILYRTIILIARYLSLILPHSTEWYGCNYRTSPRIRFKIKIYGSG